MKVIMVGYMGKMGVGKSTIADLVSAQVNLTGLTVNITMAFADALKSDLQKLDVNTLNKTNHLRTLMQAYGSYRRNEDGYYWIKRHNDDLKKSVSLLKYAGKILIHIPDVRFHNEVEYIKGNNGVIVEILCNEDLRLKRLLKKSGENVGFEHESENQLNDHNYVTIKIDNSSDLRYISSQVNEKLNLGVLDQYGIDSAKWNDKQ